MSVEITAQVFRRYPAGGGERLLALALADCANPDGTRIFPSVETLASMSAQSVRSVQRQLSDMLASGWLILVRKSTGRRGDCTEYRISPEWLAGGEPLAPEVAPCRRTAAKAAPAAVDKRAGTGDKLAPVNGCQRAVDKSPARVTSATPRVTPEVLTGDTAVSPNPSLTVIEPNTNTPPHPPCRGVLTDAQFAEFIGHWPACRRIRLVDVRAKCAEVLSTGQVTAEVLLAAAAAHAAVNAALWAKTGGGRAITPLRWLDGCRWVDAQVTAGAVDADWSATRSGVEAMAARLGMDTWDAEREPLFRVFERRVHAELARQTAGGMPVPSKSGFTGKEAPC